MSGSKLMATCSIFGGGAKILGRLDPSPAPHETILKFRRVQKVSSTKRLLAHLSSSTLGKSKQTTLPEAAMGRYRNPKFLLQPCRPSQPRSSWWWCDGNG